MTINGTTPNSMETYIPPEDAKKDTPTCQVCNDTGIWICPEDCPHFCLLCARKEKEKPPIATDSP